MSRLVLLLVFPVAMCVTQTLPPNCLQVTPGQELVGGNLATVFVGGQTECAVVCYAFTQPYACKSAVFYQELRECRLFDFTPAERPNLVGIPPNGVTTSMVTLTGDCVATRTTTVTTTTTAIPIFPGVTGFCLNLQDHHVSCRTYALLQKCITDSEWMFRYCELSCCEQRGIPPFVRQIQPIYSQPQPQPHYGAYQPYQQQTNNMYNTQPPAYGGYNTQPPTYGGYPSIYGNQGQLFDHSSFLSQPQPIQAPPFQAAQSLGISFASLNQPVGLNQPSGFPGFPGFPGGTFNQPNVQSDFPTVSGGFNGILGGFNTPQRSFRPSRTDNGGNFGNGLQPEQAFSFGRTLGKMLGKVIDRGEIRS